MKTIWFALFIIFLSGCSMRPLVVDFSRPVIESIQTAYLLESDVEMARQSFPSIIKIAEGLYQFETNKAYYPGKLCFLMTAYTFAFVDESPYPDLDEKGDEKMKRTLSLYKRAYDYGMQSMNRRIPGFERDLLGRSNAAKALAKVKMADVETVFWLDFAWAMRILNDTADPALVTQLEVVKLVAERLEALDPAYLAGGPDAVLLAYYGGRTVAIGGNPVKSEEYRKKAQAQAQGRCLIPAYVDARYVLSQSPQTPAFDGLVELIRQFPVEKNPNLRFINAVIQHKIEILAKKKAILFGG